MQIDPPATEILLGGYGYFVERDGDGICLTRMLSECTDCDLKDSCPEWVYEPGLIGIPAGCKATMPTVADTYDIYHLPVREDYPEWSEDEFKSIVELYKRRNEL